jgi:hypothetical protein
MSRVNIILLPELSQWRNEEIDYETDVPIYLKNIPHRYWPEAPSDTSMLMYGQEAIVSFDWNTGKRAGKRG